VPSTAGVVASSYSDLGTTYSLLRSATLWLDAALSPIQDGYLYNLGTGGETLNALNARLGSTSTIDINDPVVLTNTGRNYLYLPFVTGNSARIEGTSLDVLSNEVEYVGRLTTEMVSATGQNGGNWICKTGGGNRVFFGQGSSAVSIWFSDGVANSTVSFPNVLPSYVLDGVTPFWIKVNRRASDGLVKVLFCPDKDTEPLDSEWIQLGSTTITRLIQNVSSPWYIGTYDGFNEPYKGKIYRVIVRDQIGGPNLVDVDFTKTTSTSHSSFTCTTGQTITILRGTSGLKSCLVTRPTLLFGADDYLEVADNDLLDFNATDSFSVIVLMRQWATPTSFTAYMGKSATAAAGSAGYVIYSNPGPNTPAMFIGDATTAQFNGASSYTNGNVVLLASVIDRTVQTMRAYTNNNTVATTSTAAIGSLSNALTLRIGGRPGSADMEFIAAAIFRRALSASEIAAIVSYYGAG